MAKHVMVMGGLESFLHVRKCLIRRKVFRITHSHALLEFLIIIKDARARARLIINIYVFTTPFATLLVQKENPNFPIETASEATPTPPTTALSARCSLEPILFVFIITAQC